MSETIRPQHFGWQVEGKVATITLNRPEKKNPLTFGSYGELVDTFRRLARLPEIKVVVITGAGENFSSGGDTLLKKPQLAASSEVMKRPV